LIYNSRYGPVALPSEDKIHDGSIVFRTYQVTFTEEDLRTGIAHAEYQVVVEADQVDPGARGVGGASAGYGASRGYQGRACVNRQRRP